MLFGSLLCAVAMLILGFTSGIAGWFATPGTSFHGKLTIWLAVLSIYIIDFSVNAVQAADRALLVDTLPTSQQERGNAWAGRMLSFGSVIGFWVGNWDLPALMPWFGRTQLQVLCVLTSLGLLGAHAITCVAVRERVLVAGSPRVDGGRQKKRGAMGALKDIWENVWRLPGVIQHIVRLLPPSYRVHAVP
jgi:solute carrier family 45 protein 1/2/4